MGPIPHLLFRQGSGCKVVYTSKLLFYFRALPLHVSRQMIDTIQREVNRFIWCVKKPHLGKMMVYRPRAMGGLGMPNLWLHYLSARLVQLAQWHAPPTLGFALSRYPLTPTTSRACCGQAQFALKIYPLLTQWLANHSIYGHYLRYNFHYLSVLNCFTWSDLLGQRFFFLSQPLPFL